ncbi:hypothetical protein ACFQYP_17620 [Nonomuraea antimicrobica]
MTVAELGTITAEPTDPSAGSSRAELLTHLDDTAAKTLLADPIAPLMSVQIRHLGGAFTRPSDSPHGPLAEPHALYLFGVPADPATTEAITAKQRALTDALPVSGRKPFTFLSPGESVASAFLPLRSVAFATSNATTTRTTSSVPIFPSPTEGLNASPNGLPLWPGLYDHWLWPAFGGDGT